MSGWNSVTVGDVAIRVTKGTTPTIVGGGFSNSGISFVKVESITGDGRIDNKKLAFISAETNSKQSRSILQLDDLLFSIAGTVGRVARVNQDLLPANTNQALAIIRPNPALVDVGYLLYCLRDEERVQQAMSRVVQSVQANLSLTELSAIKIDLPSLGEQRAISEVLVALDDKIAANAKLSDLMHEVLETEVQSRWLGCCGEVSSADSISILDLVEINPSVKRPAEEVPFYVDMKKLPESGSGISDWEHRPAKGGARFMQGDTLLARITPCLQNRKTGFVDFLEPGQVGVGSTEFIVLRSRPHIAKPVSYFLAVNSDFRDFAIRHMVGTSGRQRVSSGDLTTYRLPEPDSGWLRDFGLRAETQFAFLKSLRDENRTLAATRDVLLPQLMSGKVRVKDAERVLEGVL